MPSALQTAAAWQASKLKGLAGRAVSLAIGPTTHTDLTAWVGMQEYTVIDTEGFATSVKSYDWQFLTEDIPEGVVLRPGVVVVETETGAKYEAMPLGSKPCVEDRDAHGQTVKLHTKKIT